MFIIPFQVMNIKVAYSMLLGRPWIHLVDAIPSSFHQMINYVIDKKLVIICAKESLLITQNPLSPVY